jgi:hypothetical protein
MRTLRTSIIILVILVTTHACNLPNTGGSELPEPDPAKFDFGDAPDPSFPSLLASNGARTNDLTQFWLGSLDVPTTAESDANVTDLDTPDDGLTESQFQDNRVRAKLRVVKSQDATAGTMYFNLLVDADGNRQWQDVAGAGGLVREWVVRNQPVDLSPGQSAALSVEFDLFTGGEVWMRAMVSDIPVPEVDFPNGWDGTHAFEGIELKGEVEDHRLGPYPVDTPTATMVPSPTPTITEAFTPTATNTLVPTVPLPPTATQIPTKRPTVEPFVITLESKQLTAGQPLRIRGSNFTINGPVRLDLVCERNKSLGDNISADDKGKFQYTFKTKGLPVGFCTLTVRDEVTGRIGQYRVKIIE